MEQAARTLVHREVLSALAGILKFDPAAFHECADLALADAGIDSLGMVEAVFCIEECFDIAIPFNANEQSQASAALLSVGQLVDQVVDLVLQKRVGAGQLVNA